jgi:Protein of unknown function (DUF3606)
MANEVKGEGGGQDRQDRSFRGGDPRLIDYENAAERAYWCKSLMVGEAELYAAVVAVGNSAQKVKDWLAAKRQAQ